MKRILMVGALSIQYVKDNWVKPIREMYDAACIDVSPLLASRKNGYHEQYLLEVLRRGNFDVLFFYSDAVNKDFSDDFFGYVRAMGVKIVAFHADDEPEVWYRQNIGHDHRFDLVASHSLRGVQQRLHEGWDKNRILWLPWGFNENLFHRDQNWVEHENGHSSEVKYDIVFIGTNLVQEHNQQIYLRDGYSRQQMLTDLYYICQELNLELKLFGFGWERHPVLKECAGGLVANEEMARVYQQARIVFNPGFSADDAIDSYQTKLRHFEVAGAGAFQLTNENPELSRLFQPGKEIVFFRNREELKDKINYFITHDEERYRIAKAAYQRAHGEHTMGHRLRTLFGGTDITDIVTHQEVLIKTMRFSSKEELRRWLDGNKGTVSKQLGQFAAIHFIVGDFVVENLEYSFVRSLLQKLQSVYVIGIRTYLEVGALHDNYVQRKKQDMHGLLLTEEIDISDIPREVSEYIQYQCPTLSEKGKIRPLINYLLHPSVVERVVESFLNLEPSTSNDLGFYCSGAVVNDFQAGPALDIPDIRTPPYVFRLRKLLEKLQVDRQRLLIYGVRGDMADRVFGQLKLYPNVNLIGAVDRNLQGRMIAGIPIYGFDDIPSLKPDMVIIAAETSGSAIYESLKPLQHMAAVAPLYDLSSPIWDVLLPFSTGKMNYGL
ncbi:glycosyltransferase [Heliobacillus mobilis]|uniref:Glycosyltransferase n=1 Tax=Heliobacterium mobile TaxID=28064 RepID=A0A6I3SM12_HELMO|nr:glycosyltransferase [Heliobacterium mobile]MTV49662.1 glycosyltransferase [Heliobacterium mobile]